MTFGNVYEDRERAESYARLEFPGTYYLAYRDLPSLIAEHVNGYAALDFGCGAGRSTRFVKRLGMTAVGIDISAEMLTQARRLDPEGDYRLVADGELGDWRGERFDLVLSVFTFDNVPTREKKVALFRGLRGLLRAGGRMINLVSAPEIYVNEWASFTTRDFPENRAARSGDRVRIIMTDVADRRPVEDIVWSDAAYRDVYDAAGLTVVATHQPLGRSDEPFEWKSELTIAPWTIYVLAPA
ncbi:MAG TPA: class I SAM-dependent methyltransferase [bacterium]|nr:class I SAM-dependent methyltransferase [bacterium]